MKRCEYAVPVMATLGLPARMKIDDTFRLKVRRTATAGTAESVRTRSKV